jgi:glycosyltransferase involved in cell wall biosynthesis
MKLSIIIAVYNGKNLLAQTLENIREQKTESVEIIVIDGGSDDGTSEFIMHNLDVIDCYLSEPDEGIYDAWNKGLLISTGEWISYLGAGDTFSHNGLLKYIDAIDLVDENCDFVSSKVRYHYSIGKYKIIGIPWDWYTFQRVMKVAHVGAIHNRRLYERIGFYDTKYKICGDYELLLRAKEKLKADFINAVTVEMAGGGVSNSRYYLALREAANAKRLTGGRSLITCTFEFCRDFFKSFIRESMIKIRNYVRRL